MDIINDSNNFFVLMVAGDCSNKYHVTEKTLMKGNPNITVQQMTERIVSASAIEGELTKCWIAGYCGFVLRR